MWLAGILVDADSGTETPVYFGTDYWLEVMDWARFHGLDPMEIPAGSLVTRDPANYAIHYTTYARDPRTGKPLVRDGEAVTCLMVERGEAPPLPFPPVGGHHAP